MRTITTTASAMALVGAMMASLSVASAGTLPVNSTIAKPADGGQVIQARFVGHGRAFPGAVVGGIAAGIIGSAIANGAYGGPYPYGYYYPPGYYGPYPYGYYGPYPY
jgi:hypothetical protein